MGVAAGMSLAAAGLVTGVAQGDRDGLIRAGHVLLYTSAVHQATMQTQNPEIWPLLYTAACAVNAAKGFASGSGVAEGARGTASVPLGGMLAANMLRGFEQQLVMGDAESGLASARRYLQMGHPSRALAGVIGSVASSRDATGSDASAHVLPLVAAAAEEYLDLPQSLQGDGQNALLTAAIRLASELSTGHALADRVSAAIDDRI
jgi:hypothetical protein